MPKRRWNSKALAERRRRVFNFYVAGFTQEEIAEKVGMHRSVVSRDLQWVRDSVCPGESPDVQEAWLIQMERMKFNPQGLQFDPTHPPLAGTFSPEEVAESWKERRVYDQTIEGYCTKLKL
jgi:IS30 family transposase